MPSASVENYIKAIYQLQSEQSSATLSALAERLQVSPASATNMVKKLTALKLVRHSPYHGVELSSAGEKMALEVVRHHRLVELFLAQALGVPWDRVHVEAEKIEHVLSEELEDRIAEKLGNPVADPHGDPIPSKSGEIGSVGWERLSDLPVGSCGTVRRVGAQEPQHLRYLAGLGLVPSAQVQILEQAPFGGPVRVQVGPAEHMLDENFARQIWVTPTKQFEPTPRLRKSGGRNRER